MYRYLTYNTNKSKTIQYFMLRTFRECFAYLEPILTIYKHYN